MRLVARDISESVSSLIYCYFMETRDMLRILKCEPVRRQRDDAAQRRLRKDLENDGAAEITPTEQRRNRGEIDCPRSDRIGSHFSPRTVGRMDDPKPAAGGCRGRQRDPLRWRRRLRRRKSPTSTNSLPGSGNERWFAHRPARRHPLGDGRGCHPVLRD